MNLLQRLHSKGLIHPPRFVPDNTHYLVIMGSESYGVSDDSSDRDIYGWCIPPKEVVFPHLAGCIDGFGNHPPRFSNWQQHHIDDTETKKQYDISMYSVVQFFQLCMENNPNIIDSLFVPRRCIIFSTQTAEIVRENRKKFLHRGAFHKFKGYAFSQMSKLGRKVKKNEKRQETIDRVGYDCKNAYQLVRLCFECEQILTEHDLDLERNREQLKAIRRGEWSEEQVREFFVSKEKFLEKLYEESTLPFGPDEDMIKALLMKVLESHYGSLGNVIRDTGDMAVRALLEIRKIVDSAI